MIKDIAIYGFGGFGREVACLIHKINEPSTRWNLIGYFDDGYSPGMKNQYGKVLGNMGTLNNWDRELSVVLAIGSGQVTRTLIDRIRNPHILFPNIIAPNVFFFDKDSVQMGHGNIITFGCRLSCGITLGNFNVLNGCVSLGHDVRLGDYNVLLPDVRISGETTLGNLNFLGARSFVAQRLKIGKETRIAAGSIVLRNTKDGNLYMGNPAMKVNI